jgi:antibiotic biosynthesis monooxygenase (ABM) superfamily enzyme
MPCRSGTGQPNSAEVTEGPAPHAGELPVTVTIARRVQPGLEIAFEDWAARLSRVAATFPGFLGGGLLRPGHVGGDWHVVYRFDSPARLRGWEASPERAELLAAGEQLMRTTGVHRITGLETWFDLPGRTAPAPPRWKMFAVTAVAIYLLNLALSLLLRPVISSWPTPLRVAPTAAGITAMMTWVVMPRLARLLQGWLFRARS